MSCYLQALAEVLPTIAHQKLDKGGMLVLRPDSGDPIEAVMMALEAAEKVFGVDVNSKGFKIPKGCSVIYGDGVSLRVMKQILAAMLDKKFSAEVTSLQYDRPLFPFLDASSDLTQKAISRSVNPLC